jgi:hypothetical protein
MILNIHLIITQNREAYKLNGIDVVIYLIIFILLI